MRHLDPQVAADRKRRVLQWVVHNYIRTSRPIASGIISEESGLGLSSATIRAILSELEAEGYLTQPHTSAGRVPTDRGYRSYVDFLEDVQRLASNEKARLEAQYERRLQELDDLLARTSRLLSAASRRTGLVLSPRIERQTLKRIELIPLGPRQLLAIVVTQAGQVRHWPVKVAAPIPANRLAALNRLVNEHAVGRTIGEVRDALASHLAQVERDLRELQELARTLLGEVDQAETPEPLFLEGAPAVAQGLGDPGELGAMQALVHAVEERAQLARLLEEDLQAALAGGGTPVRVRIGGESRLPRLKDLSLVTSTYRLGDRAVGVLGILGPKRMEYERMMSLVQYMGGLLSRSLSEWRSEDDGR